MITPAEIDLIRDSFARPSVGSMELRPHMPTPPERELELTKRLQAAVERHEHKLMRLLANSQMSGQSTGEKMVNVDPVAFHDSLALLADKLKSVIELHAKDVCGRPMDWQALPNHFGSVREIAMDVTVYGIGWVPEHKPARGGEVNEILAALGETHEIDVDFSHDDLDRVLGTSRDG